MTEAARFVLVTGLSGAGKSQALHFLEDLGYYCVDNLPAALIPDFVQLTLVDSRQPRKRVAACVDARAGEGLKDLPGSMEAVEKSGARADILFLDSSDDVLIRRYSESRRRHPSSQSGGIEEGIRNERKLLQPVREMADLVIDTSSKPVSELRERVAEMFLVETDGQELMITVVSFGFKYGLPQEADLVFDVRFLPNPHYDPELRPWSGNDTNVRDFVLRSDKAAAFLGKMKALLQFLVPCYREEAKSYLTIAVGCTGGRHRSVAIANELLLFLRDLKYEARLRHRDIARISSG